MRYCASAEEAAERLSGCQRIYPNLGEVKYIFFGDWGRMEMTYAQYLFSPELRRFINSKANYRLELGRRIYCYSKKRLSQDEKLKDAMSFLENEKRMNPLQFFMPNGKAGIDFLNDRKSTIKMMVAGNRYGKTCIGIIDMLLDVIPCDPNWAIFKENGVKYRTWDGKQKAWGAASYMWRHITTTVAPLIINWAPDALLGDYSRFSKKRKTVSADKRPFIEFTNGSKTQFFVYEQDQENFESAALNGWLWDEQGQEKKFDGADERTRTLDGRHIFPLTPHRVEGRPDTGAGTWIHKLWLGEFNKGHTVGRYQACTYDNPDWNYPEKQKRMAQIKHFKEPAKRNDEKALAEGRSRVHGDFHETSGLVYDDLRKDIHLIEPFDIPKGWSRFRGIDHGKNVSHTACVFAAVDPNNNIFIYDEYYQVSPNVYDSARGIAQVSGNKLHLIERRSDVGGNTEFDVFQEGKEGCEFEWTKLDGRSFSYGDSATGRKVGDLYQDAGLDVSAARGGDFKVRVPLVSEYLRVDYDLPHAITKEKGAPKLYIMRNVRNLIRELFSYKWSDPKVTASGETEIKPVKGNDHAVNAFEYLLMSGPCFMGTVSDTEMRLLYSTEPPDRPATMKEKVNRITGY
jgi:hypothetical protein